MNEKKFMDFVLVNEHIHIFKFNEKNVEKVIFMYSFVNSE